MILSLASAGLWGGTDVLAGISSRRSTPVLAALWLHLASLAVIVPFLILGIGVVALDLRTIWFGIGAGVFAAIGDVLFGRALVVSSMSVGIPLANVIAAAIPAAVAVLQGDQVTTVGAFGIAGAALASGLAAAPSNGRIALTGAWFAMSGGVCFGLMYGLMSQVPSSSSLLVIFVMRLAGTVALAPAVLHEREHWQASTIRDGMPAGMLSGVASVAANAAFIAGMSGGSRALHAVVAIGLSAPVGVLIVQITGRERLNRFQGASVASGCVALALLAANQVSS